MFWKKKEDHVIIQPYLGYSSDHRLYLNGRVLEDEKITTEENETFARTIWNNFKRLESDEVRNVPITLEIGQLIHQTMTDREGYFTFDQKEGISLSSSEHWLKIILKANFIYRRKEYQLSQSGEIYLPSSEAVFGIISDIDDTILHTDVLSRLKMLRNTLLKNAYGRQPLPGMSAWLNGLRKGPNGYFQNPVFYVSRSPRNIFDYLSTFLTINDFPKGPILLRDFGKTGYRPDNYAGHKKDEINRILLSYPELPFILIGDIADRDPEIYRSFQEKYPHQIIGIYLRNIKNKKKSQVFQSWYKQANDPDIQLIENAEEGVLHSIDRGWLHPDVDLQIQK